MTICFSGCSGKSHRQLGNSTAKSSLPREGLTGKPGERFRLNGDHQYIRLCQFQIKYLVEPPQNIQAGPGLQRDAG